MKQFLRSLCTLLLLMMWCSVGLAQTTVTFDATKDKGTSTSTTLTKDGVTLKFGDGKLDDGVAYRWYAKSPQTLTISSTETITKIEFTCTANNTSSNGPGKISKPSTGKYTYIRKIGTWTGETNSVVFSNTAQVRMTKIVVTLASSKTPTTLTFQKSIFNIEEGNETTFTGQTAKLKTSETVLNNAITYTTNNDAMFETYDANVGPKALKTGKYGTATVTAKFNGDDTYEASTATYTVNYTEKEKPATTLDFGFTTKTVNIDETFTAAATLKSGETAIKGAVTYSSSKSEVADVDKTTGEVLAFAAGKTTITATFAGTSEYKSSTASYELTVVDPNATEETFDFTKPENYVHKGLPNTGDYIELEEGTQITSGIITITNVQNGNTSGYTNKARFHNKGGDITFRVYANGTISLSAQTGYTITRFAFEATEGGNLTTSSGTYSSQTRTWEGNAQSLSLTFNAKTFFQKLTVTYSKVATTTPLTLEEDADDTDAKIEANNGKTIDVKLTRSLKAGLWNTICLPFDVTAEQVESVLKATDNIKEFDKEDKATATIFFKPATEMKAGVPYLIKPTEDATVLNFKGVTINNVDELSRINGNDYCICGVFGKYTMKTNGTELFLNAAGKFVAPAAATNTMKGFRAYFMVPSGASAAAININIDGETTGINNIETEATVNGKVYNLNGQYVGNSLNGLKKGIYVVNGKKVIK